MKLIYATVILRHGARTPQSALFPVPMRGHSVCDSDEAYSPRMYSSNFSQYRRFKKITDPYLTEFLPNCQSGDLLLQGMKQHHLLGEMYHKYFTETTGLFTNNPDLTTIYARSTNYERTFRSAQSFLDGAFPPVQPNEYISIVHGTEEKDVLRPSTSYCAAIKELSTQLKNQTKYQNYTKVMWDKVKHISDELNLGFTKSNLTLLCDYLTISDCDEQALPSFITEDDKKTCQKVYMNHLYNVYALNSTIAVSYVMRELLRVANGSLNGTYKYKFNLMSAHDSTITSFFALFKLKIRRRMVPNWICFTYINGNMGKG